MVQWDSTSTRTRAASKNSFGDHPEGCLNFFIFFTFVQVCFVTLFLISDSQNTRQGKNLFLFRCVVFECDIFIQQWIYALPNVISMSSTQSDRDSCVAIWPMVCWLNIEVRIKRQIHFGESVSRIWYVREILAWWTVEWSSDFRWQNWCKTLTFRQDGLSDKAQSSSSTTAGTNFLEFCELNLISRSHWGATVSSWPDEQISIGHVRGVENMNSRAKVGPAHSCSLRRNWKSANGNQGETLHFGGISLVQCPVYFPTN